MNRLNTILRQKLQEWRHNPVQFVEEVIGVSPTPQQKQLLENLSFHNNFAIRSGHGTGKSASLSWILLWFLITRPSAKIVCTAPTRRQLFDVLWSEVSMWIKKAKMKPLFDILKVQSEIIRVEDRKDWFARAVAINVQSTAEEQAEALAGYHAEHLLCIVDEASGLPDPVFRPLEGYMTQPDNKVILAGNPTRSEGYFYRIFNDPLFGQDFVKLHWSSTESPLVSNDWVEMMKRRYGEDSLEFRIRVLGEFPQVGELELIPREWIDRAVYVKKPDFLSPDVPVIWGVDVARFGSDESALVSRSGAFVLDIKTKTGLDTIEVADWILDEYHKSDIKPSTICVDVSGGLGAGVSDYLRRVLGSMVLDVNVGLRAFDTERFILLRDELWWNLRTAFETGRLYIPPHEKLKRQLMSVRYSIDGRQKIRIESKRDMKKRGVQSPDCADALCLTFYLEPSEMSTQLTNPVRRKRYATSWRTM